MVKIVTSAGRNSGKLSEGIEKLKDITSEFFSDEEMVSAGAFSLDFAVGNFQKENCVKMMVTGLSRRIFVYSEDMFPIAEKLARAYEGVTRKDIPRNYTLRGEWTVEKRYDG